MPSEPVAETLLHGASLTTHGRRTLRPRPRPRPRLLLAKMEDLPLQEARTQTGLLGGLALQLVALVMILRASTNTAAESASSANARSANSEPDCPNT